MRTRSGISSLPMATGAQRADAATRPARRALAPRRSPTRAAAPGPGAEAGRARRVGAELFARRIGGRLGAWLIGMAAGLALLGLPGPAAQAATGGGKSDLRLPGLCEAAAVRAARAEGVPLELMRAISLAETGRRIDGRFAPWPWTVNMEGEGRWFSTSEELLTWVRRRQAQGARSFDMGCFQVNHLWHGAAFEGLEQMLDPEANARYAARFLRALREETGSWETAVGHYHSRTPDLAGRYRERVLAIAADLPAASPLPEGGPQNGGMGGGMGGGSGRARPVGDGPRWWFASLSPLVRRPQMGEAPASATEIAADDPGPEDPRADAEADAQAASLAHAWLSAAAEPPAFAAPAPRNPAHRRAAPEAARGMPAPEAAPGGAKRAEGEAGGEATAAELGAGAEPAAPPAAPRGLLRRAQPLIGTRP